MALDNFRTQHITWDRANRKVFEDIRASSGDENGRKLSVQIVNDGVVENLVGYSLNLAWETGNKSKSGLDTFKAIDASKGVFELTYTTGMLKNVGKLFAQLVLIGTDINRLTSESFSLTVFDSVGLNGVSSSNDFSALTIALATVNKYDVRISDVENEIKAARGTHPVLKERLDDDVEKINIKRSQLEKKVHKNKVDSFKKSAVGHKRQSPSITFVDDDAHPLVYTKLKPLAEEYGIPMTLAIIPGAVEKEIVRPSLTLSQLYELEKLGFEMVSHTYTHRRLADLTDGEIDTDLRRAAEWMDEKGFDSRTTVIYPYGSHDERVRRISKRYHESGATLDGSIGKMQAPPEIDNFLIRRLYIEMGVQRVKDEIDKAAAQNGWIIIGNHVFYNDWSEADVRQVIEYALAKGLEFINFREGVNRFTNVLEAKSTNGYPIKISADGSMNIPVTQQSLPIDMDHIVYNKLGVVKVNNFLEFGRVESMGPQGVTLSKNLWKVSEISTKSTSPTVIGKVGSITDIQIYRDATSGDVFVKNSIAGQSYFFYFRVSFC